MESKRRKILNGIENDVDRLGDVEGHVANFSFFGFDLLGGQFAISHEKMVHEAGNGGSVLASVPVKEGTKVDRINGFHGLRNEGFFGGLANLELVE